MRKSTGLACLLLAACAGAFAAEPPAIPDRAAAETFKDAPAPWRDYLIQARAAERIADPLQRCLAFPDIPGNKWPAGHAAAHCRYQFAYKTLSLAEVAAMIDGGNVAKLEGLMDASLQRHFSEQDFNEDIDRAFDAFSASPESDRITAKWIELAPRSAYANMARGEFLFNSAWEARGTRHTAETPRASMQRFLELTGEAIPYLEKSLEINPRLMPAYIALINIGRMGSHEDIENDAIERAKKIDPACVELAELRMLLLEPRWGGDYESMLRYANELKQYLPRRPQLAIHVEAPFAYRGHRLVVDDQFISSTLDVLKAAIAIGSDEGALHDAANVAVNTTDVKPDYWEALVYLLQESRFKEGNAWADRNISWKREDNAWADRKIAWILVREEPEWSLRYALRAIELDPENGWGRYLAGAGFYNAHRYADADREYALAIKDPSQRHDSLREVAEMWLFADAKDRTARAKAKPYIDQLLREYPEDGRGWILDLQRSMVTGEPFGVDTIKATLKKIDRSDDWQKERAEWLEGVIRQMQSPPQKTKH